MALFILLGFLKSLVFRAEKAIKAKTKKQPTPGIDWVLPNRKPEGRKLSMKGGGCILFLQQMMGAFLQFCQAKKLQLNIACAMQPMFKGGKG